MAKKKISTKKNAKKSTNKKDNKETESKVFAFLAVLLSIVGFLIALIAKREDKYVMFYAKQSLILFLCMVIASAAGTIPLAGWIAGPILSIIVFVLWIIALVYSLSGKMKETPYIGKYADSIRL